MNTDVNFATFIFFHKYYLTLFTYHDTIIESKVDTVTCKLKASKKQFCIMNGICDNSKTVGFTFYHNQTFVADIISERQQASISEVEYITRLIREAIDIWHISTSQLVNDDCLIEVVLYGDETDDLQCGVKMILNDGCTFEVGYMSPNGNIIVRAKYGNCVIDWRLDNLTTTTVEAWLLLYHVYQNSFGAKTKR